jgi:RHS repeat-associated protein
MGVPNSLLKNHSHCEISSCCSSPTATLDNRNDIANRTRRVILHWIFACVWALFFAVTVAAQTGVFPTSTHQFASTPAPGMSSLHTFDRSDFDGVNLQNGNLNLSIPILSYPQRGDKLKMNFILRFNAPQWSFLVTGAQVNGRNGKLQFEGMWQLLNDSNQLFQPLGVDLVRDQGMTQLIDEQTFLCLAKDGTGSGSCYDGTPADDPSGKVLGGTSTENAVYSVRDRSGAVHRIGVLGVGLGTPGAANSFFISAPDGSGWTPALTSAINPPTSYYDRSGLLYAIAAVPGPAPGTTVGFSVNVTDPNGNAISSGASGWTDSIGRSIPGSYSGPGNGLNSNGAPQEYDPFPGVTTSDLSHCPSKSTAARIWTVPGVGSTSKTYYLCYAPQQLQTSFDIKKLNGGIVASKEASFSALMLNALILPNLTYSYNFAYDTYGELSSITFPSGGSVSYSWTTVPWDEASTSQPVSRVISSRVVNPLTGPIGTWTYSWSTGSGPLPGQMSVNVNVSKPDGNDEYDSFPAGAATSQTPTYSPSGPYSIISYYNGHSPQNPAGGSGSLLRTETTVKQFFYTPFPEPLPVLPPNDSITYYGVQTYPSPPTAWVFWSTIPGPTLSKTVTYNDNNSISQEVYTPIASQSITYVNPGDNIAMFRNEYAPLVTCVCIQYGQYRAIETYDVGQPGSGKPGPLLRTTIPTYLWNSGASQAASYLAANLLDLPYTMVVKDQNGKTAAETDYTYDENNGSPSGVHGNLTSVSRPLNTEGAVKTRTIYTGRGMPAKFCDPIDVACANPTIYTYDSTGVFPSSIQYPTTGSVQHLDRFIYDESTGKLTSHTDQNNVVTKYSYDDPLDRLTLVASAVNALNAGGQKAESDTAYKYPSETEVDVAQDQLSTGDHVLNSSTIYDGMGHAIKAIAQDGSVVETGYDGIGRVCAVSNPGSSGDAPAAVSCKPGQNKPVASTDGFTYFSYDALGRKVLQTQPDNSTQRWAYSGNLVDIYDEDGSHWQQTHDGLGRLTTVKENDPAGSGALTLETDYAYDVLDNLLSVRQLGASGDVPRVRYFQYDSLSRMTNACNPEAINPSSACSSTGPWSASYTYDANGNVSTRTDALSIVTHYTYDALNRVTAKSYTGDAANNTPSLSYSYDTEYPWQFVSNENNPMGQLNSITAKVGTTNLASWTSNDYDQRGRLLGYAECLNADAESCPGTSAAGSWDFNLDGSMADLGANAGDATKGGLFEGFTYVYDSSGRMKELDTAIAVDSSGNELKSTAVSGPTFYPGGAVHTANLAIDPTTLVPGITLSRTLDNRGRLTGETDQDSTNQNAYQYSVNYDANSNVSGYTDSVLGTWTVVSDSLHRPTTISGTYNSSTFQEAYDHFGNRNVEYFTNGSNPATQPSPYLNFTAGNNRAENQQYDFAGHLLSDGTNNYRYDAEGRLCAVQQIFSGGLIGFFYAPDGPRLGKQVKLTNFSCDVTKNGMLTADGLVLSAFYIFGSQGEKLGEMDQNFVLNQFNVFWEGKLLGSYSGTTYDQANWHYALNDWLGTKRVTTQANGSPWTSIFSGPFGDYQSQTGPGSDPSEHHFTGKERDAESGLDYFGARYYGSSMGRWMSPDWSATASAVPYSMLTDPQSLNLFSYVLNNPIKNRDADGHVCILGIGNTCPAIQPPPPSAPKPPAVITPGTPQYKLAAAQEAARNNPKF